MSMIERRLSYRRSPNENPERSKSGVFKENIHTRATKMLSVERNGLDLFECNDTMFHWSFDNSQIGK